MIELFGRQKEIFALLGSGLNSKQIGLRLHVNRRTIDKHIERMAIKLGLAERFDLLRSAILASTCPNCQRLIRIENQDQKDYGDDHDE